MVTQIIHKYLLQQDIRISTMRIDDLYSKHPLPHSIRSISDTLDALYIPNMVCQLNLHQLFEIEGPFIVVFGKSEYPFFIVKGIDATKQQIQLCDNAKSIVIDIDLFAQLWTGVVLLAYKDSRTKENSFLSYHVAQLLGSIHKHIKWFILGVFVLLNVSGLIIQELNIWYVLPEFIGLIVSYFIIIKSQNNSNLLSRFCRIGKRINCDDVFKSEGANLLGVLPLGVLSLIYFVSILMCKCIGIPQDSLLFLALSGASSIFIIYSIGWQISYHKWCTLCIIIDIVLIIDLLIYWLPMMNGGSLSNFTFLHLIIWGCIMLGGIIITIHISSLSEYKTQLKNLKFKHEQLLNSPELFWMQIYQQNIVSTFNPPIAISNNISAEHSITLVMNPFCPKCAIIHKQLSSLKNYKINLVIITDKHNNKAQGVALAIISYALKMPWDDWLLMIDTWYERHLLPDNLTLSEKANEILDYNIEYCNNNQISGTPFIAIDNRQIPPMYDIADLIYLL